MPTISTAHYTRLSHAFVAVEHADGATADEVKALLDAKALDIGPHLTFWANNDTETQLVEVVIGVNDPDYEEASPISVVPNAAPSGAGIETEDGAPMGD